MDDDFFFQPDDIDLSNWQPMDISQISEDPWLSMVTSPDATGLENLDGTGSLSDLFNISNGGIAGMDPAQYAALFGGLANAARPPGATSGYAGGGTTGSGGGAGGGGSLLNSMGGLSGLLPLLLAAGSGIMGRNATNQATQQTVNGINAASDQAKQLIGAAQANYAPFTANVGQSLAKLAAPVNLAGNFKPLGSGKYGG